MCQELAWFGVGMIGIKMYAGSFLAVLKLLMSPGRWHLMASTVSACLQV